MLRRFGWIALVLSAGDILFTEIALYRSDLLRRTLPFGREVTPTDSFLNPYIYLILVFIWLFIFQLLGVYRIEWAVRFLEQVKRLLVAVPVAIFVLAGALYLSFRDVPRLLVAYFLFLDLAFLCMWRLVVALIITLLPKHSRPISRILIVGAGEIGQMVAKAVASQLGAVSVIVGYADDKEPERKLDYPLLGPVAKVPYIAEVYRCNEVIVALPWTDYAQLEQVVEDLQALPVRVHVVPDFLKLAMVRARVEDLAGLPLIGLREPIIEGADWTVKRAFDLVVSLLALFFLWPIMLLIALAIVLDSPGPVFFRQKRIGENGQPFWIYKFRTMVQSAEDIPPKLQRDEQGHIIFKVSDDPRITAVGRFLRRTSLDELPNLFNVIKGEMSLVGPRPEVWTIAEGYEIWQRGRLAVPPGITGWWQVSGRSDLPMHLNTQYDLFYIRNYSLWLDLKILFKTVGAVLRGKGAY
jgi:exopolysaccharide biosynthesis polyprenyl glycosylphosphotransferase